MYTFSINGVELPLKDGIVIKEELNEKMDSAVIVCNTDSKINIAPFDSVIIRGSKFPTRQYRFLVDNFIENITSFTPVKTYEYVINLFSETKYLERITLPSLSITYTKGIKRSVSFYIQRILDQYLPKIKVSKSANTWEYKPKYNVDAELLEKFNHINCPEFSWNDPTLKEVLDDLLMVADCIVKVKNNTITFFDLKQKGQPINEEKLVNAQRTMASADYVSDLAITMKNAIGKNLNATTEYQSVRSEGGEVTTENMIIPTNHPIYNIKSVKACFNLGYSVVSATMTPPPSKWAYVELDITWLIKEQDEFNVLDASDFTPIIKFKDADKYQKYCLYYKRGNNKIENLGKSIFYSSTLQRVLVASCNKDKTIRDRFSTDTEKFFPNVDANYMVDYREIMFKVEYETLAERKLKVGKYLPIHKSANEVFDNQTSSYVDVQQQSIFEYAKANRLGNEILMIYGEYQLDSETPQLGDYLGDSILFSREITYYDNYIQFKGTLTKNYILKNYFTGIQSKRRSWQIAKGSEALTRYDIFKLYGEFSFKAKYDKIPALNGPDGTIDYNLDFFRYLLAPVAPVVVKGVKHAVVLTKSGNEAYPANASGYELELNSEIQGRSICFNFGFNDNYSVGDYVFKDGGLYRNGIYKYADLNGEFDFMSVRFLSQLDNTDGTFTFPSHMQELTSSEKDNLNVKFAKLGQDKPKVVFTQNDLDNVELSLNVKNFYKDNREIIKYTLQIEFCSDTPNIVVTDYFVQRQQVVRETPVIVPIKIYTTPATSEEKYKIGDTQLRGEDHTEDYNLIVSVLDNLGRKVFRISLEYIGVGNAPRISSWGIGNQYGALLLGVNPPHPYFPVFFNILADRNDNVYDSVENQKVLRRMWG